MYCGVFLNARVLLLARRTVLGVLREMSYDVIITMMTLAMRPMTAIQNTICIDAMCASYISFEEDLLCLSAASVSRSSVLCFQPSVNLADMVAPCIGTLLI